MNDWLQLTIIAFIIGTIGWLVWKGGASNPVGTGKLQRDVTNVREQVTAIGTRLEGVEGNLKTEREKVDTVSGKFESLVATLAEVRNESASRNKAVEALAESIRTLNANSKAHEIKMARRLAGIEGIARDVAANRDSVRHLVKRFEANDASFDRLADRVSAVGATTQAIEKNVDRIYNQLVQKGMN